MAYVAMKRINVGGSMVEPGTSILAATVDGWPQKEGAMSSGEIRYVPDAALAQFQTDLTNKVVGYAEMVPGPERAHDLHRIGQKKQVR